MFTRDELQLIAELCQRWDVLAISDEIYERIVFDGHSHVPIASLPGMAERTVTTSGLSKTYSVTGWRIGWAIAPPALTGGIRKMHDFLTVAAPTPFHDAGVAALSMPDDVLRAAGCRLPGEARPDGRHPRAPRLHQLPARRRLLRDGRRQQVRLLVGLRVRAVSRARTIGVATVPGSSFYIDPSAAPQTVRFCFSKRDETLHEADRRLARLSRRALGADAMARQVISGDRA